MADLKTDGNLYDIRHVTVVVGSIPMIDIGDGVGITPKREAKLITTAYGEVGFSFDPSTAAEVTINLLSTSPSINYMKKLVNLAALGAHEADVPVTITSLSPRATGFQEIRVAHCLFSMGEISIAGEAPTISFKGIAYGYTQDSGSPDTFPPDI